MASRLCFKWDTSHAAHVQHGDKLNSLLCSYPCEYVLDSLLPEVENIFLMLIIICDDHLDTIYIRNGLAKVLDVDKYVFVT